MTAIVEFPRELTRPAFQAVVDRMRALPDDAPNRDALIAAAERNLAMFEAAQAPLDADGEAIVAGFFDRDRDAQAS